MNGLFFRVTVIVLLDLMIVPLAAQVQIVSAGPGGAAGDGESRTGDVSADGRWVAFQTLASTLVDDGPDSLAPDIVLLDRLSGELELISVGPGGAPTDLECLDPHVSDDGSLVVFLRRDTQWNDSADGGPPDPGWSVWVRDRAKGTTFLASVDPAGTPLAGPALSPAISGDGRRTAFIAPWDGIIENGLQVVVRDLDTNVTRLASVDSLGQPASATCDRPCLSRDGRFVAFACWDTSLASVPAAKAPALFVKDLLSGDIELASVSSLGVAADAGVFWPELSADGQRVVFHSDATNLVVGDDNAVTDVFVRDLVAGWTRRASIASDGSQGSQAARFGAISPDGRYAAFESVSQEFAPGDRGPWGDVFVHDFETLATEHVSVDVDGGFANGHSGRPRVSEGGLIVAFESAATDLVPADGNGETMDVFLMDRGAFTPLGGAAPGGPHVLCTSALLPGGKIEVLIGPVIPGSAGLLLVGAAPVATPVGGGILFTSPPLALVPFHAGASNEVALSGHWPAGVPSGEVLTVQPVVGVLGDAAAGQTP